MENTEQQKKGEKAFNLINEVIANEAQRRTLFLRNMEILQIVEVEDLHKAYLGDPNAEFKALLADPKIYYPRTKVAAGVKIISKLLHEYGLGTIVDVIKAPIERLGQIVRFAQSSEDAQELLEKAEVLIPVDWKEIIKEREGKPAVDDGHQHDDEKICVCKKCGRRKKVE